MTWTTLLRIILFNLDDVGEDEEGDNAKNYPPLCTAKQRKQFARGLSLFFFFPVSYRLLLSIRYAKPPTSQPVALVGAGSWAGVRSLQAHPCSPKTQLARASLGRRRSPLEQERELRK
jgi:hypothetical protein